MWLESKAPCHAQSMASCEAAAAILQSEALRLVPAFAAELRAGHSDNTFHLMLMIQQRLLLMTAMNTITLLDQVAQALQDVLLLVARPPAEGKDPDPCYCGHGLGIYSAIKASFVELMEGKVRFRDRLRNQKDWAHGIVLVQDCRVVEPAASWPVQHMVHSTTQSDCAPSYLVSILLCAQQNLLQKNVVGALRFALAAFVGASMVPRCLTGTRDGARSAWPFTFSDVAQHVAEVWHLLVNGGDPLGVAWGATPGQGRDEPHHDSPCLRDLAFACVLGGSLHTNVSRVKFCDEEGIHTLQTRPLHGGRQRRGDRRAWLLPVMSLYNPWHSLLWAVSALEARDRGAGTDQGFDVVLVWPTDRAPLEIREGWPAPFWPLAELLAPEVRLASTVRDECFSSLRVGRGHLMDSTVFAMRGRRKHFLTLARAVAARWPEVDKGRDPLVERVLFVQRNPVLARFVTSMETAAHKVQRLGVRIRILHDGSVARVATGGDRKGLQDWAVITSNPLSQIMWLYKSSARVLVGAHGAALAFAAFLPAPAALIELSPTGWRQQCKSGWDDNPHSLYGHWCTAAGISHRCIMSEGAGFSDTIRNLEAGRAINLGETFLNGNISLSATTIVDAVMDALSRIKLLVAQACQV